MSLSAFFDKPNGWQRLWVVLSVPYAIGVLVFALTRWPTDGAFDDSYRAGMMMAALECQKSLDEKAGQTPKELTLEAAMDAYSDMSTPDLILAIKRKLGGSCDFSSPEEAHAKGLQAAEEFKWMVAVPCVAFGPPLGLYLFGAAVGWVVGGFRKPRSSA